MADYNMRMIFRRKQIVPPNDSPPVQKISHEEESDMVSY